MVKKFFSTILFWKKLILCSVLFNGIIQHCIAMNKAPFDYTVFGEKLKVYPISCLSDKLIKVKKIGSGAYGKVILMENKEDKSYAAFKISSHESLLDEAFILQMLDGNERIIASYAIFYEDNVDKEHANKIVTTFFLALEYAEGGTLRKIIKKNNQNIKESVIREYAKQIMEALVTLNQKKIMHLDLKLNNIVLTKDNKIKVIDFGKAKICKKENLDKNKLEPTSSDRMKDYNYEPPENDLKCPYKLGLKADLWSFGYLLYCLVTSKKKLALSFNETRTKITVPFDEPEWELVSKELKDLIKNLMICNPDDRLSIEQVAKHPWFEQN